MMAGWVMICEVVGKIELDQSLIEAELTGGFSVAEDPVDDWLLSVSVVVFS